MSKLKERDKLILFVISLLVLLIVGIMVRNSSEGILLDKMILEVLKGSQSKILLNLMKFFSFIGSAYFFIPLAILLVVYFIHKMERRNGWLIINASLVSYLLNAILKVIFRRGRPIDFMRVEQGGYSFPSGHSMVSMSFFLTLGYILSTKVENESLKIIIQVGFLLLALMIGFSRNYLGVHWPSDVVMGFLLGFWLYELGKTYILVDKK